MQKGEPLKESIQIYQQKLLLMQQKEKLEWQDQQFLAIKKALMKEREIYFNLGSTLINKQVEDNILDDYMQMIQLNENRFSFDNGVLIFHQTEAVNGQIVAFREKIVIAVDQQIAELERSRKILEGKIASEKRREELANLQNVVESLINLKTKLITETQEALNLFALESDIVANLDLKSE